MQVFHIAKPPSIPAADAETMAKENQKFEEKEAALKQKADQIAQEYNLKNYNYLATTGSDHSENAEQVAKEICAEIEKQKIDMIVMGCRAVKMKKYLGSVSDYIVKNTEAVCLIKKFSIEAGK